MIIIWSGMGFLGLLIPAVCIFPLLALSTFWWDANDNTKTFRILGVSFAVGCGLSVLALWFLGRWLNRPRKDSAGNEHTLFFIPVQFWAFVWLAVGGFATVRLLMG